jgi:hypothetical protein
MFCVPSGVTANFATVSEIRGIREKTAKGVGKTAFAGLFRPQRGLAKGYWHGELGTLEGKLHHFEITPIGDSLRGRHFHNSRLKPSAWGPTPYSAIRSVCGKYFDRV